MLAGFLLFSRKGTLMLKRKSIAQAGAAALIAVAPACFAQTAAPAGTPSGTIGTFGATPGAGPAPITGGTFNSAPGAFASPPSSALPSVGSPNSFGTTPGS